MALVPVTVFGTAFTSQEVEFLTFIADHSYLNGELIIGNSLTGDVSINTLTAGAGVTITNGPGTITISLAGGSGVGFETPSGLVNGSNTVYTVTQTPKFLLTDGAPRIEGIDYSRVGLTITMDPLLAPTSYIRSVY